MMASAKTVSEKVILFPTAIDHYQVQLISYLECEKYREALALLRYLQQFSVDEQTSKEWHVLITWLQGTVDESEPLEDNEWTEEMFLRQRLQDKMQQEKNYVEKLLDTLTQTTRMEKQLITLEQLTVINHPSITPSIQKWLETKQIHPLVQYKALQVLRAHGGKGVIKLHKNGHLVQCAVELTPMQLSQHPIPIRRVLNRVIEASENGLASIGFFAEEMWNDFIAHIYGSQLYLQLARETEQNLPVWASVLHHLVMESLNTPVNYSELADTYGIDPITDERWRKSYMLMKNVVKQS